jgi:hypothetical protein
LCEELVPDFVEIQTVLLNEKGLDQTDVRAVENTWATSTLDHILIACCVVHTMVREGVVYESLSDAEKVTNRLN